MLSCRIYSGIASKAKKGGPQATFFLLYKIIIDKVVFCVYYLCEWSFYHENKDFVRFNRRGN